MSNICSVLKSRACGIIWMLAGTLIIRVVSSPQLPGGLPNRVFTDFSQQFRGFCETLWSFLQFFVYKKKNSFSNWIEKLKLLNFLYGKKIRGNSISRRGFKRLLNIFLLALEYRQTVFILSDFCGFDTFRLGSIIIFSWICVIYELRQKNT